MKPKYENFTPSDIQYSKTRLLAAIALKNKGQLDKSIIELKGILSKYPTYAAAHFHIAEAYIGKNNWIEATKHLGLVRLIDPEDINAVRYLEAICVKLNLNEAGRELSDIVESTDHTDNNQQNLVPHLINQASLLIADQQYEKAIKSLKLAEKQDPNNAKIALELGQCFILLGKSESAAEVLKKAAFESDDVGRYTMSKLAYCGHHLKKSELSKCIELLEVEIDKSKTIQPYMTFALANFLDLAGFFEKSWNTLSKANTDFNTQLKNTQEVDKKARDHILASVKKSTPQKHAIVQPLTTSKLTPIFILGVSRSGKSTLERLLGEVKGVKKGFENRVLNDSVVKVNQRDSRIQSNSLRYLPPQFFNEFSKHFVNQITLRADNAQFFTTTDPTLITNVTAIVRSLPHSKFVFIKRDMRDNAIRILQSHYGAVILMPTIR